MAVPLGGYTIDQDQTSSLPTSLPLPVTTTPVSWHAVPDNFKHRVQIQHGSINVPKFIPDIAGRKLSLTYSSNGNTAYLNIDDQPEAQGTPPGNGILRLSVTHPYAGKNEFYNFTLRNTGSYVIISAFGGDKHSTLLSERQRILNRMTVDGTAADAPELLTETLNVIGQTWMQQTQLNGDLLDALSSKRRIWHHRFGLATQETGYAVDMPLQTSSTIPRKVGPTSSESKPWSFIASAMEHSVLEQLQGIPAISGLANPAVSTIRLFALSNSNNKRLFVANSSNFSSISPALTNYSPAQLSSFQGDINNSNTLILPEDGKIALNDWEGFGYVGYKVAGSTTTILMAINGGLPLNGGYTTKPGNALPEITQKDFIPERTWEGNKSRTLVSDPVDLGTGAFYSNITDFGVGGSGARGLAFTRSYDGQLASQDAAGLGRGWTHNYNIYLSHHSNVEAALGERTVFDAVPMVVVNYIARSLLADATSTPKEWGTAALVANWGMDQLLNKSVSVHMGSQVLTFQEMPNGDFIPPAGITTELVRLTDDTYELRERFGTVWKFNANDKIGSITDVDGNALTFTYTTNGQVASVTDAFSRVLSLGYADDQLSWVFDSTGHSVTYEQEDGNLRTVNGLEGGKWEYEYDEFQRLLTVTNPVDVKIVDNTYNDFDRVIEQKVPRDTGTEIYKMHYAGFLASEEDAQGHRTTYHFDLDGRKVAIEDALGNTVRMVYDGQGHLVKQTDPKGNASTFVYDEDGHNNLIEQVNDNGKKTISTYDANHRLVQIKDPLGHNVQFAYNAKNHVTQRRDHYNNTVATTYSPNGLLKSVTDPLSTTTNYTYDTKGYLDTAQTGSHPSIDWTYDDRGNMESLSDQEGANTQFVYDDRGLVEMRTDPKGQKNHYQYTAAGQLKKATDRKGRVTDFT